ncbi:MAG: hypothetical protein QGD94_05820, partial [Planctomycetia bacterium]|nr:hypothetical protein [Planctomycetia bacterium]
KKFRVGTGPRAIREEAVNFVHDIEVDPKKDLLVLRQTKITSKLITAQVAGTIANYSTRRELDLRGSYKTSLEDVTALIHQLAPETAETVSLAGVTQSEFKITGPAYQPEFRPVFRKLDGGADVGWASAHVFGLALGKAKLSPTLSDGQLKLPLAAIPASGGKLRVRGVVDFRTAVPTLRMPGKTVVLENVELTPEVGRLLLSRFNPIFARVTHLGGRASLTLRDIVIPLDSQTKDKISGRGQLDLTRITVGPPSGILKELLTLLRLVEGDKYPMKFSSTDFVIKDGRIEYDNFTLSLGEGVDLRFYGSVGFDDTLDMVVSVPVGVILLEKLNVKGPLADYARLLEGSNVDIRIVGTRLKHKLKLSDVDILPLIKRAARALLSEELLKRIKEALGDTKPEEKKPDEGDAEPREPGRPPPDQVPEAEPPEKKPEEELLDNLLDFLMDKIEDSKQDKEKRKEEEKEPD